YPGQIGRQDQEVGWGRQRRDGPVEVEIQMEIVRWLLPLVDHLFECVLQGEQDTRVDVESQVEIERTATTRLGMEIHLPRLAQRVGLDDVPLVVDMETVIDGVFLEIGNEAGDVDGHESRLQPSLGCW